MITTPYAVMRFLDAAGTHPLVSPDVTAHSGGRALRGERRARPTVEKGGTQEPYSRRGGGSSRRPAIVSGQEPDGGNLQGEELLHVLAGWPLLGGGASAGEALEGCGVDVEETKQDREEDQGDRAAPDAEAMRAIAARHIGARCLFTQER